MLTTKPQWKPPPPAMQKQQRQSLIRLPSDRREKELLGTYHAALFFLASSSRRSERPPLARLARPERLRYTGHHRSSVQIPGWEGCSVGQILVVLVSVYEIDYDLLAITGHLYNDRDRAS
ncbi:unnamed protein product [Sphagnum tenellum]